MGKVNAMPSRSGVREVPSRPSSGQVHEGIKAPATSHAEEDFQEQRDCSDENVNNRSSSKENSPSDAAVDARPTSSVPESQGIAQATAPLTQKALSSVALATLNDHKTDRPELAVEDDVHNSHDEQMQIAGQM